MNELTQALLAMVDGMSTNVSEAQFRRGTEEAARAYGLPVHEVRSACFTLIERLKTEDAR